VVPAVETHQSTGPLSAPTMKTPLPAAGTLYESTGVSVYAVPPHAACSVPSHAVPAETTRPQNPSPVPSIVEVR
jgi:hypothetical protein